MKRYQGAYEWWMQCLNNETSSSSEISKELGCTEHDVDPGWEGLCVVAAINKFTWTTEILWRKGMAWPLSEWERAWGPENPWETRTPAWIVFYCFSGHITLRMVLIYNAQVHCRWLSFTDNKGKNVANYFQEKDVRDQGENWLNWLHSIFGRFSTDFRKLKLLSKHLLPQSRVRVLAKASLIAV